MYKFWPKMQILAKNANFGQKCKFWPKIQILAKNPNFRQKSKFSTKIYLNFSHFYGRFLRGIIQYIDCSGPRHVFRNIFHFVHTFSSIFNLKFLIAKFWRFFLKKFFGEKKKRLKVGFKTFGKFP